MRTQGIPINIRNTNHPEDRGTMIVESHLQETSCIRSRECREKRDSLHHIDKAMMNSEIGFGRRVLGVFEITGISFENMPPELIR